MRALAPVGARAVPWRHAMRSDFGRQAGLIVLGITMGLIALLWVTAYLTKLLT